MWFSLVAAPLALSGPIINSIPTGPVHIHIVQTGGTSGRCASPQTRATFECLRKTHPE